MAHQDMNCPRCGQMDMVYSVCHIYKSGIMWGTSDSSTRGTNGPSSSLRTKNPSHSQSQRSRTYTNVRTQTELSKLLAPPEEFQNFIGILVLVLILGGGLGVFGYAALTSDAPLVVVLILWAGAVFAVCYCLWGVSRIGTVYSRWKKAKERWKSLSYCARCYVVFQSTEGTWVPADEMKDYLSEKANKHHEKAHDFPGIETNPAVCGGEPCIVRTRLPIWVLVRAKQLGTSDADLLRCYPTLRAEDLVNAWAYFRTHKDEIEQQIRENEEA